MTSSTCPHHWILESPQEARERNARQDSVNEVVKATCKLCGALREYPTDKQIDERYDAQDANESVYTRRQQVRGLDNGRTGAGLWNLINIEPVRERPEPSDDR